MRDGSLHGNWTRQALCTGLTELFTSEDKKNSETAKRICYECPVIAPCRKAGEYEVGVWGGTDETERREARRRGVRLGA